MSKEFKILAIDGGGFRGVYPAHLLKCIEEEHNLKWNEAFDLIAGTSTGSIIAAALACGHSAAHILELYKLHGARIFKRWRPWRRGLLRSRYSNKHLKRLLREVVGNRTLGDIDVPLIIPATDIGNGCVHVFKSDYDKEFVRDKDVRICDAVLASCSAPTYFNPHSVGEYLLADGGLWANSPGLAGAIDAKRRLGVDLADVRVVSIGTGTGKKLYSQAPRWRRILWRWGILTRWGGGKFVELMLNLQSEAANNMLTLLLGQERVLRLNFETDSRLRMDDHREFKNLVSRANTDFTRQATTIWEFLDGTSRSNAEKED